MRAARWKLGFALAALMACGDEKEHHDPLHVDRGDLKITWNAPQDAAARTLSGALREGRLFEKIAEGLDATLKFPRDLPVRHTACGEENAFYDPNTGALSMCYELLEKISVVAYDDQATEQELGERVVGTWMFVFFHELGHGLIDMYDLPITGREEDSVDDFSTVLMVQADLADYALHAASFWAATGSDMVSELDFADEHSLNQQRFYSILCLVYGSNPRQYQHLVSQGILPESRAARCPAEFQQKSEAWSQLLEPWSK
ncbi:MAG TPA: DUF4344 domain-containing metallopeptidase [Polyangiales bacterium]